MDVTNAAIGARVRKIREERGYTREQLSEYADISADFLWEVESGKKGMKVQILGKLAAALDITADYLIFGKTAYTENEKINSMLAALPNEIQSQVEKMITVFVDTLRISTKKVIENDNLDDKQGD